ncbi:patatin-like phospholipase family protein [Sansalvadorimonas sp. 2012CJ34-2]|uniref:Patatin-like phospholipase family protein n=1 Tax=Parendozoicomonas callyspongiae TaxID=2942213 RepID=A0ABT0PK82_9GAMM|nr:patatin-like phospholipase family protein [Sansalvadorimonas sp. 2012CJ34-2]MCL6271795.1 patatin-like phospholipase family protein [Sansalvadorimonas sp. 2012CJ34-2]
MASSLVIQGGHDALQHLREKGFQQEDVKAMLGASGGPKWFALAGLDKALLGVTFKDRTSPLHLLGTSAGCWRFTCYSQNDPLAALQRFEDSYITHSYSEMPTASGITREVKRTLSDIFNGNGAREILSNPVIRLNLIAVQAHGLIDNANAKIQGAGLLLSAAANAVSRNMLGKFYTRIVFTHPGGGLPVIGWNDLPTKTIALSEQNLEDAVLASGSIPVFLEGVRDIEGAGQGLYLDGGVTDYHFDLPMLPEDGLVLYPHFRERPIPGWFDKYLGWRIPSTDNYRRTLIVSPSSEFVARLPYGKIPDRKDFQTLDDTTRQKYWRKVVAETDRLGEEWLNLVENNRLAEVTKPLSFISKARPR